MSVERVFPVISHQDAVIRLVVATVTGSLIGPECEIGEQSAGLRTHALVSLADALFLLLVIKPVERRLFPQRFQQIVRVTLKDTEGISDELSRISTEAQRRQIRIFDMAGHGGAPAKRW